MKTPEIVAAVRAIIGDKQVKLHAPDIGALEHRYVRECVDSGDLAHGPFIQRFEETLAETVGRKYCVATSSGTAALHLAVSLIWRSPAKVALPSLTFIATANALKYCGHTPVFCDIGQRTDIMVGILGGRLPQVGAPLEDAAPCLGSRGCGTRGHIAVFSFNGNKICTAGGGGALLVDDENLAREARHLASQAKSSPTEHDRIGFNYRMPNYNAALGLAQIERLPEFLERKACLASKYETAFGELFWKPPEGSNNWLNAIMVENRDEVVSALNEAGYESRALHAPLHTLPMYETSPRGDMTRTMEIWDRCVCLPSGAGLA